MKTLVPLTFTKNIKIEKYKIKSSPKGKGGVIEEPSWNLWFHRSSPNFY